MSMMPRTLTKLNIPTPSGSSSSPRSRCRDRVVSQAEGLRDWTRAVGKDQGGDPPGIAGLDHDAG